MKKHNSIYSFRKQHNLKGDLPFYTTISASIPRTLRKGCLKMIWYFKLCAIFVVVNIEY